MGGDSTTLPVAGVRVAMTLFADPNILLFGAVSVEPANRQGAAFRIPSAQDNNLFSHKPTRRM